MFSSRGVVYAPPVLRALFEARLTRFGAGEGERGVQSSSPGVALCGPGPEKIIDRLCIVVSIRRSLGFSSTRT